ncbi:hypothetical protein CPAR01_04188 [Colletotrichum paranaense]|uniref:Uncharacterized protein n=1 Tax=Colletotrichum paranaense TaxID=1914294 RepID=A0ABQ9SVL1_9PEZI|nr:uncharacterized protein CPAR01_04188 [Colletotrichum paranaense]KAK1543555.1 hypothetical protein CPAR01_04188 [Colletotrichum paranaense]
MREPSQIQQASRERDQTRDGARLSKTHLLSSLDSALGRPDLVVAAAVAADPASASTSSSSAAAAAAAAAAADGDPGKDWGRTCCLAGLAGWLAGWRRC